MSRHRTTSRLPGRKAWALAAPAFGALGATFLAVLVPPSAFAADKDCGDFASQAAAQAYFNGNSGSATNDVDSLDRNHNGVACETFTYAGTSSPTSSSTANSNLGPADVPQGGVAAGDGDASGLFRLF